MTVQLKGLSKHFNEQRIFENINYTFEADTVYCLMGPSGMGKTTLLRIILGLEQPTSGNVSGTNVGDIATMFQENRLCEELTPIDNVMLVLPRSVKRATVRENLAQILPAHCLDQPVHELSGGMKRRVALARTLHYPSKMLIMDEPFTGLDVKTKRIVIDYLQRMRNGRTALITTHSEEDVTLLRAIEIQMEQLQQ